jgi:hypothetical protein
VRAKPVRPPGLPSHPLLLLVATTAMVAACAEVVANPDADDRGPDAGADAPNPDTHGDPGADPSDEPRDGAPDPDAGPDGADAPEPDATPPLRILTEEGDWPDCFDEATCPGFSHGFTGFTVELDPVTGEILHAGRRYDVLEGTIEEPAGHPFGYDSDFIAIRAPVRTVIEISVEPVPGNTLLDPYVTTYDAGRPGGPPGFRELTTNDDRAAGDRRARTVVAAPYADAPLFVWLDDARNYRGTSVVGGAAFGYRVRFSTSGFSPTEVELGATAVTRPGVADLALGGDLHFYRFRSPGGAWRVVFRTANPDFAGTLIGFDTQGGALRPVGLAGDALGGTDATLPSSGFLTSDNEHVFAVTDWFGRGTSLTGTRFDYTLTLEPEQSGKAR